MYRMYFLSRHAFHFLLVMHADDDGPEPRTAALEERNG